MPEQDLHATETNHAEEVLDVGLPADHQPTKIMQPGKQPFHSPAVANTPAGLMEPVRSYCPISIGFPSTHGGSAPALNVSGPAQRSPTVVTAYTLAKSP